MFTRFLQVVAVSSLLVASLALAKGADTNAHLKRDVGTWNITIKMYPIPDGEPLVGAGTETNALLGDLWLIGQFQGQIAGLSFEGSRRTGLDPEKKKLVASWVDSKTPYATDADGEWDETTQTMTWTGSSKTPSGQEMKAKMLATYHKDGTRTTTMFAVANGKEVKIAEFHYTRADAKAVKGAEQDAKPASDKPQNVR